MPQAHLGILEYLIGLFQIAMLIHWPIVHSGMFGWSIYLSSVFFNKIVIYNMQFAALVYLIVAKLWKGRNEIYI